VDASAETKPPGIRARLAGCLRSGAIAGGKQALWLLALMIPISLAVTLLAHFGALRWVAGLIEPGMRLIGQPGETAAPMITAAALNLYSGIAALGSIGLTDRQVTILAFFMLSCHNLPVEVAVQKRAGSSAWKIVALRLGAAAAGAVILNLIMPPGDGKIEARGRAEPASDALSAVLWAWTIGSARLIGKVVGIVVGLMILQKILAEFGIARHLARFLAPVLAVLGLPRSTAFLWIAMNILGLAYGAGVLVEEVQSGRLPKQDVELLNRSAAVCHSLLEDTLLFVAIGAWALWITVPRLILAAAAVWGLRAWRRLVPASDAQAPAAGG
jgi:hypothetical protein